MLRVRVTRVTAAVFLSLAAVSAGHAHSCDDWMCGTNGPALNGTQYQGSTLQGTRPRGLLSETTIISSAGLVRVELPR
jgi:hypothetical protein